MKRIVMMVVVCIGILGLSGCVEVSTVQHKNPTCAVGKVPKWNHKFVLYDRADEIVKYVEVDCNGNVKQVYYSRDLNEIMSDNLDEFILTIGKTNYPFKSTFVTQVDSDEMLYIKDGKVIHWWDSDYGIKTAEVINLRKYIKVKNNGTFTPERTTVTNPETKVVIVTNVVNNVGGVITSEAPKISRRDLFDADFDTFFHNGASMTQEY